MINKHFFDGSLKFCEDFTKIENYSQAVLDTTQTWDCHHRLETHYLKNGKWIERDRDEQITKKQLIEDNKYYDVPASELIFLTKTEHMSLHNKERKLSEEHKTKISSACKGKKRGPQSNEHKAKLSAVCKGKHWKLVDGKRVWY